MKTRDNAVLETPPCELEERVPRSGIMQILAIGMVAKIVPRGARDAVWEGGGLIPKMGGLFNRLADCRVRTGFSARRRTKGFSTVAAGCRESGGWRSDTNFNPLDTSNRKNM